MFFSVPRKNFWTAVSGFCGAVLIYSVFCLIQFSPGGKADWSDADIRSAGNEFLCLSTQSVPYSRILRNGRQRNVQLFRGSETLKNSGSGSALCAEWSQFEHRRIPAGDNVFSTDSRSFWIDFYISALPVRAGPAKISI